MNGKAEDGQRPNDSALSTNGQAPEELPPIVHEIFFGADGLRAGWSLVIYVTLFVLLGALVYAASVIGHILLPTAQTPSPGNSLTLRFMLIGEFLLFVVVLLVGWVMSKIEGRPNSAYGLGGRGQLGNFFAGLGWGIISLSLLVLTLWKTGLLVFDGRLLFGRDIFRYGALWFLGFLCVGLFEEYLNRGYVQYTLTRGLAGFYRWAFKTRHSTALGFWTAALAFSIIFGLGHGRNPGESPIGLVSAGLDGFVFCLSLWRTGSLWWAIGCHASWDWAQSFLYGVGDSGVMIPQRLVATHTAGEPILSGGATGPEGSIYIFAITALTILVILFTLPRRSGGYASNLSLRRRG